MTNDNDSPPVTDPEDLALLQNMDELKEKVRANETAKATLKGQGEILSATFEMVCCLMERILKNKNFQDQIVELKSENESLKKQLLTNEFDSCSRAVLIKGIEKRTRNGKESKMILKNSVTKVLKVMKIDTQVKIDDVFRIVKSDEASTRNDDYIPPIELQPI